MRHAALLVFLATAVGAQGALIWRVELVSAGLETVLTSPFGSPGPVIDVYHVVVPNTEPFDVTSLELNLSGPFINNFTFSQLDFQDSTDLPAPAGTPVADSFFVTPRGTVGIGRDDIDDENGILSAAYTIQGGAVFIPAGGEAVVAVLSVPAGASLLPAVPCWDGFAAVDGELVEITTLGDHLCVPEPATALLATMAGVGLCVGRRL